MGAILPGLADEEFRALVFSVGKTSRDRRPLGPVEVGALCAKAVKHGATKAEITEALKMTDKSMITKFLRLRTLSPEIQHLVSWGFSGDHAIGFSAAAQLARLAPQVQQPVADALIKYQLSKDEMTSVIQLLERSGDPITKCIDRVVRRRPVVRIQYIVLGAISESSLHAGLARLTQLERDERLTGVIEKLFEGMQGVTAKLGTERFTLICDKSASERLASEPKVEAKIVEALRRELR